MGEGLGGRAAAFQSAEDLHGSVVIAHRFLQVLAFVTVAGLVFLFADGTDVHPVRGVEQLGLLGRGGQ